jgi:hypothetical protein
MLMASRREEILDKFRQRQQKNIIKEEGASHAQEEGMDHFASILEPVVHEMWHHGSATVALAEMPTEDVARLLEDYFFNKFSTTLVFSTESYIRACTLEFNKE